MSKLLWEGAFSYGALMELQDVFREDCLSLCMNVLLWLHRASPPEPLAGPRPGKRPGGMSLFGISGLIGATKCLHTSHYKISDAFIQGHYGGTLGH